MDPCSRVAEWVSEAREADLPLPESMTLATADPRGAPSARTVLLKAVEGDELVFGTALNTLKGRQLQKNPLVALVLHWPQLGRQVRVCGVASGGTVEQADALWAQRGRDAQLVDLVSQAGLPLESTDAFRERLEAADAEHGEDIPRPGGWSAIRVQAQIIEFWSAGERRMAVREEYRLGDDGWTCRLLEP
jgi:pyridoxamine 5'-phosphate oxidase